MRKTVLFALYKCVRKRTRSHFDEQKGDLTSIFEFMANKYQKLSSAPLLSPVQTAAHDPIYYILSVTHLFSACA